MCSELRTASAAHPGGLLEEDVSGGMSIRLLKSVSESSQRIVDELTDGIQVGDSRKMDRGVGFMPVHVDCQRDRPGVGPLFSVAHYYESNGDLVPDPDVVFLHGAVSRVASSWPLDEGQRWQGMDGPRGHAEVEWRLRLLSSPTMFRSRWRVREGGLFDDGGTPQGAVVGAVRTSGAGTNPIDPGLFRRPALSLSVAREIHQQKARTLSTPTGRENVTCRSKLLC
jgi:hypothetical protein